ncbi:MAG: two-component sensor histidine kinase, partial [Chloroflexota bacterium]|nr:two-component sensor histidine kinase [Chloroflexota bacterium]
AKQLPLRLEAVSPADVVDTVVERLRPQFDEKGLELDVDVSPSLPVVRADRERAIQVLTNLLTSALRYTPAPGRVGIAVRQEADGLQFSVSDSGIGLAANELARVFERFYRAEKSRSRAAGGAGIGLTIGKALIEAMGGRIWADSAGLGQGATFGFLLPLAVRSDPLTKS